MRQVVRGKGMGAWTGQTGSPPWEAFWVIRVANGLGFLTGKLVEYIMEGEHPQSV